MKETNLDMVKDIAICLLNVELDGNGEFAPMVISHPFFSSGLMMHPKTKQMVNILEDEQARKDVIAFMKNNINNMPDALHVQLLINTPYLRTFFNFVREYLGEEDYNTLLSHAWKMSEFPSRDTNVEIDEMYDWFVDADKKLLMDEDDIEKLEALPDRVKIYRGVDCYTEDSHEGLSWTLSEETARFFANRFNRGQKAILSAEIDKKFIFAYFDSEEEVVVDFYELENVTATFM